MDETRRRKLSIARELATWGTDLPVLLERISAALKLPNVSGRQKLDFEAKARQITTTFHSIGETPDPEASEEVLYAQLLDRTDRLRELIAAASAALDRLSKPPDTRFK
jgi:hypothetical protein